MCTGSLAATLILPLTLDDLKLAGNVLLFSSLASTVNFSCTNNGMQTWDDGECVWFFGGGLFYL